MSTAKQRLEGDAARPEGIGRPLSAAEQAFFDLPDDQVKPPGSVRIGISEAVSEAALRTVLRNHPDLRELNEDKDLDLVDSVIAAARQLTPPDMRVHPDVRARLSHVLYTDPRFNGQFGNSIGYSEFITRALDALGCER